MALRIFAGGVTLRFDKDGPARTEPPQGVVQPAGDADQFRWHCGIQIRPTKPCRALKRAILVEDDALVDQSGPGQKIHQMGYGSTILSEVHHARCLASNGEMAGDAQMAAHHVDELRIALRGPDRGGLTENPEQETGEPQPQAETERRRQGAIEDRDRARRAAEQNVFGERAMNGNCKSGDSLFHQTSAPPPKEKNERKKELAANAIERPNTIWISRRKPPEVSPNASVRPVTMMMMTAMILATGPSTDCRIWFNGCSHGMLELAACAGAPGNMASIVARVMRAAVAMTRRMRNGRWITAGLLRVKGRSRQ